MNLPEVGPGAKVTAGSTARPVRVAAIVDPAKDARRQETSVIAPRLDPAILAEAGFSNASTGCIGSYLASLGSFYATGYR